MIQSFYCMTLDCFTTICQAKEICPKLIQTYRVSANASRPVYVHVFATVKDSTSINNCTELSEMLIGLFANARNPTVLLGCSFLVFQAESKLLSSHHPKILHYVYVTVETPIQCHF